MTKEEADLIPLGTIVVGNFRSNWNDPKEGWLTPLVDHDRSETPHIVFGFSSHFHKSGCLAYPRFKPVRLATPEEIVWLTNCIEAGKTLPKPTFEIINDYQIY